MPFFETDGVQLHYQVHGQGSAIVFTHGASWDHRQWDPQQATLAAQTVNAQYQIIPDAGHATNLDSPQGVNQTMAEFLMSHGFSRTV
jgi:pimeloyl-ACP methyl ester carboxylesterase